MGLYFLIPDAHSWYFMPLVAPKFFKFLCVFGVHDLILIFFLHLLYIVSDKVCQQEFSTFSLIINSQNRRTVFVNVAESSEKEIPNHKLTDIEDCSHMALRSVWNTF